jgi:hypothetical protein
MQNLSSLLVIFFKKFTTAIRIDCNKDSDCPFSFCSMSYVAKCISPLWCLCVSDKYFNPGPWFKTDQDFMPSTIHAVFWLRKKDLSLSFLCTLIWIYNLCDIIFILNCCKNPLEENLSSLVFDESCTWIKSHSWFISCVAKLSSSFYFMRL